ncbi:DctP family TRAP transporter solute-binding subunit [Aestuariivirga sp.]|uniref:DctP family TRAP transporter solute-binding subunit n=1 Tax=Aestuariivirga sp. TaxID=2650926 RepID=UPI0039E2D35B
MTGISNIMAGRISRRAVLASGAAGLAVSLISTRAYAAAKVIRISTPGPDSEWQSKGLQAFKAALESSMPGAFDVQIHYNGTLFAQGSEIEAMQRGNLEVGMISPSDVAELIPEYSIFTTGYLFRDNAHLDAVYDGDIGKEFKEKIASTQQIQVLKSQYLGTRHVILRQPRTVNVPDDLKGVKLRMPGSAAWQFLGNALGASATPLAFEEVYLAMQTGTIDGLENPLPDAISSKFYEVSKQVVLTGHQVANTFFTFSKPFWDGLSDDEKKAVMAAAEASKKANDDGVLATEKDGKAFFEAHGNTVTTPDVAAFRKHVLDAFVSSDFAKSWPAGLFDRINAA